MPSLAERLQQYYAGLGLTPQQPNAQDYDPNYELGLSSNQNQLSGLVNNLDLANNQGQVAYTRQMSNLGRERDDALTGLSQRLADRGILRSGANVVQQGKIGDAYQRSANEAGTNLANMQQQNEMNFNNAIGTFGEQLKQLQAAHNSYLADRQAERARTEAEARAAQETAQIGATQALKQQFAPAPDAQGRLRIGPNNFVEYTGNPDGSFTPATPANAVNPVDDAGTIVRAAIQKLLSQNNTLRAL